MQTLHWALRTYRERIVLAASFGGVGGLVLLDLALRIEPKLPVYYIDTGLLFAETYDFVKRVERRYGIAVQPVQPELTLVEQRHRHGDALWARDPNLCCNVRKVQPQRAFLAGYAAWITGLHRAAHAERQALPRVSWDAGANVVKVSPLALLDDAEIAAYADANDIPRNPLLERGYSSIGCWPCTRPTQPGEDLRAGRWAGFDKRECGLHLDTVSPNGA